MQTHCFRKTDEGDIDLSLVLEAISKLPDRDWESVVRVSEQALKEYGLLGKATREEAAGKYSGAVLEKDDEEVTLKFFVFGPGSDTPFHSHATACGLTNAGRVPLLNINFKVLLKNPISGKDTLQIESIDVLGPGDSMVDSEYMVKKGGGDHGHGVVNPDGEDSGHSVHPYRLGRVVGKECSNDRIYEHNDLVRDFMASLKECFARGGDIEVFNGSVFHLDWHPAEEKQAKGERRHYPRRDAGEGTRECMTWGGREAARAAVAEKGVRF